MGHLGPDHLPAAQIGALAHGVALRLIVEQFIDGPGKRRRVLEGHQNAPVSGQHLLGVPVGRGDDRLARAQGVGQRAGSDLFDVAVRRNIEIGRSDELVEFRLIYEAIVEKHVLLDILFLGQPLQRPPVDFAVAPVYVRMGRAEDHVDHVRMLVQDVRQGADDVFVTLVGRKQTEAEQNRLALDVELILVIAGIDEGHIWNAVRNQVDLPGRYAIDFLKKLSAALAHDHQPVRQIGDLIENPALGGRGFSQDRVECGDDRHAQFPQQGQDMAPGPSAEDAVLVLERHHIHVIEVQKIGRSTVGFDLFFRYLKADAGRIGIAFLNIVDGQGNALGMRMFGGYRLAQIGREGSDAAPAGQVVADKCDPLDGWDCVVLHGSPC